MSFEHRFLDVKISSPCFLVFDATELQDSDNKKLLTLLTHMKHPKLG